MKLKGKFFTIAFFSVILSFNAQAQQNIITDVEKATVFSQGAQIERNKRINLEKGENILRFVNLERSININTIQVYGSDNITIVSTDYKSIQRDEEFLPDDVINIIDSIFSMDRVISLSNSRVTNYQNEKNMILANKNVKGANEGLIVEDLIDLADYYRVNLNKLDELIYDETVEITKLKKEKSKLQKQLNDKGFNSYMGVIEVKIIANSSSSASLKLTYIVNGVSWAPFYDIKSGGIDKPINVISKASVTQNTGVNWKNVKLSLSTSTPMNYGVVPEVHPWTLYFRNEYRKNRYKKMRSNSYGNGVQPMSNASYGISSGMTEAGGAQTLADFTKVTESMTNREFKINLPYNIKGSNGKAIVELDKFNMEADYIYYTAPKFDKNVYLLANIDEWEQYNLLPGSANIFLKGTYVGNSFIDPSEVSDTLSLMLGKDLDLVVDRKKVKDYCKKSFVGGKKTTELGLEVLVKNKKNKEVHIIVEDQVPISKTEDIEVKILDKSRAKHESETGKLTWDYKLKAGESKKHLIRYEVKYPKNKVIGNL